MFTNGSIHRSVDGPCDLSHPPAHVAEEGLEGVSALLGDQGAAVEYQDLQLGTLGQQRLGTLDRGAERWDTEHLYPRVRDVDAAIDADFSQRVAASAGGQGEEAAVRDLRPGEGGVDM